MDKIKTVSLIFRILFQCAFVLLPIISIFVWVFAPAFGYYNNMEGISFNFIPRGIQILHPLSGGTRLLGFTISLLPLIVNELMLFFLIKLFRLYEKGEIFSIDNVNNIKNIGYTLLLGQLINPFYQALISLALTWDNPHGHRYAEISFSGTNIAVIMVAIFMVLISWIMAEGTKLNEEQKYIV